MNVKAVRDPISGKKIKRVKNDEAAYRKQPLSMSADRLARKQKRAVSV